MVGLRALGDSGIPIRPLVLGGNVFGWTADKRTSFSILDAFVSGGGSAIDTADTYSRWVPSHQGGESELIIGEWLKRRGRRDDVQIITKVGGLAGEGGQGLAPARIASALAASLRRLQTNYVDLYLAHKDDPATSQEEVANAFDSLVREGKVRAIGASNFTADRLTGALGIAERGGLARYGVIEPEYNLLERSFEDELQPLCIAKGIGAIPYYGLASGYLTGKYRVPEDVSGRARGNVVSKHMRGKGPAVLSVMDEISAETGASLAAIAIAWLAAKPGIAAPIASATSVDQVEDLLTSFELHLSGRQIASLDKAGR